MEKKICVILLVVFVISVTSIPVSYEQSIPITISGEMDKVIFDGKWTFTEEWKHTSLETIQTDSGPIHLRISHQDNFIYVFIDAIFDTTLDKGSDMAIVCIDSKNDKSELPDTDDYCIMDILDGSKSFVLQGGSPLHITNNLKQINNLGGFIGISSPSDSHDLYSMTPHVSYEFRIPIEVVGRSNSYGFFATIYDAHANKFYSWPDVKVDDSTYYHIPSPKKWGEFYSPDNTLPEFSLPSLALLISMISLVYFSRKKFF